MTRKDAAADLILVGGGLANSLIALRLAKTRPDLTVLMLDRAAEPGAGHTWSFHNTDIAAPTWRWLAPAVAYRWPGQSVCFPAHARTLRTGYNSITPASLSAALDTAGSLVRRTGCEVTRVGARDVELADGTVLAAPSIIDGRGQRGNPHMTLGFQKFVGVELEVSGGHGLTNPIIMDATVSQDDGYRFVYCLPHTATRVLVEDTRYSDDAAIDRAALKRGALDYAAARGWRHTAVVREEAGVLPIALAFDAPAFWRDAAGGAVPVGLSAALFHPVTGYSLPLAARVADLVAATEPLTTEALFARTRDFALKLAREQAFLRFLNRMLFRGCAPERRYKLLERFYRLPEPLIERFYAGSLRRRDQLRIVVGNPPIPLWRAAACLPERHLLKG